MGLGKTNPLTLVFEECAPSGGIPLPDVPGIEFGTPSVSNQTTMINFRTTRRVTHTYPVQPQQRGSVTIPTFSVQTDKGAQVVSGIGFEVGDAAVGQSGLSISDVVESQLRIDKTEVWAGEVVEVEYLLIASGRHQASISSEPQWNASNLIAESFGEPERIEVTVRGERRPGVRYRTRFIVTSPGTITLEPIRQDVTIQTGERSTFFFSQPRLEEFSISSNQPQLVVRELPQPAPAGFTGAVGDFSIESKIVPDQVRVGEPITWTLTLSGDGNWVSGLRLPEREVSTDFQVVQPKSREEIAEGRMFTGSLIEDAVLVPTRPGTYPLGPVPFSYFDPAAGRYVEKPVEARTLEILPAVAPAAQAPPANNTAPADAGEAASPAGPSSAAPLALPGDLPDVPALPRDPLAGDAAGFAPFTFSPAWWLFAAFVPPVIMWLGLAWREVRRADSVRVRQAARREMIKLLGEMGRHTGNPSPKNMERWRECCIAMWSIPKAAPTAAEVRSLIERLHGSTTPAVWEELWQECEDALFCPGRGLGSPWITRALHAAREAKLRRSAPPFPHRWRYWAPASTAVLALLFAGALFAPRADAADKPEPAPAEAYREGRYDEARAAWSSQLARNPRDWVAHNNVALAFAQQDRWPEAAAHWIAAFLLNPRDDAVRANLSLALSRMDGVDPELRRLVRGSRLDQLATFLSPGEWQMTFFLGAAVSAAGLVCMVIALYRGRNKTTRHTGLGLAVAGLIVSVAAMFAETRYGMLARPAAGLVVQPTQLRSIPTDLTEKQQTAPLPPGTVVIAGDSFLGWDQIETGGAATGWVRRETVIPFYHAPKPPLPVGAGPETQI
ncbi:MAG: BatD family protein [Opitutaceae bacterium]